MMYFKGIIYLEEAKLRYRNLAKQLHPDTGGTAHEFQKMQEKYKEIVVQLQEYPNPVVRKMSKPKQSVFFQQETPEKELLSDLEKIARLLLKKQVPQSYLKNKIKTTNSTLKKSLLEGVVDFLDGI